MRERHKRQLAERLQSRPGLVTDHRVSLLTEDVVRLDLLPNSAFLETLTRKGQQATPGESALRGPAASNAEHSMNPTRRADGDDDNGGGFIVDPPTHQVSLFMCIKPKSQTCVVDSGKTSACLAPIRTITAFDSVGRLCRCQLSGAFRVKTGWRALQCL